MSTEVVERAAVEIGDLAGVSVGRSEARSLRNGLATVLIWGAFLIALIPLVWIMWSVLSKGLHPILNITWWQKDQSGAGAPGFDHHVRGVRHAIVGTMLIAFWTSVFAIPVAIMAAIYLVEYGAGRVARAVSFMLDILAGVPSVVAAIFVYTAWVTVLHWKLIPLCSSFALVLLMIPVVTRSAEEMLKLVPHELREASYALGVPKWKTILRVVLPVSLSGIVTGSLLGLARVAGETAPLLLLASYTPYLNQNSFSGVMAALPTMINGNFANLTGDQVSADRVWGAACTLILLVLVINLSGRLIARLARSKS